MQSSHKSFKNHGHMNDRQLIRWLLIAVLIKLLMPGALWKVFIADHKVRVNAGSVAGAFMPNRSPPDSGE